MEIFILGSILVALMVYVSTRVKKNAAQALESETVQTDEFAIVKPEGFLQPLDENSKYAFEAFSKDFGKGDAANLYRAQARVRIFSDRSLADAREEAKRTAGEILSGENYENATLLKAEETLEKASAYNFYKIIEGEQNKLVGELKITVLKDFADEYQARVDEMLGSFWLK